MRFSYSWSLGDPETKDFAQEIAFKKLTEKIMDTYTPEFNADVEKFSVDLIILNRDEFKALLKGIRAGKEVSDIIF